MVEELTVDCVSINGIPFTGSMTFDEMRTIIPRNGLEIDPENIHPVKYSFEGCPVVKLILKTKLDIELISHKETFEITRNSESSQGYEIILRYHINARSGIRTTGRRLSVLLPNAYTTQATTAGCN